MLRFQDYSFRYNNSQELSLKHLNFTLQKGEFITLIGATGSGKSTFLKQLLPDLALGKINSGQIVTDLEKTTDNFAYVSQFVDNQMIMETPRDELKFILDNQGCTPNEIQLRITEVASFLGIIDLLDREVSQFSGGQKQLVNLASALILKPKVLLLDEPTAQLDPVASEKLMQMIHKVNLEFGMTVILVEHELEWAVHFTDRLLIMASGTIVLDQPISQALRKIFDDPQYRNYLTQIDRLYLELGISGLKLPLNNQQLTEVIREKQSELQFRVRPQLEGKTKPVLTASKLNFRYSFNGRKVVDNVSFELNSGRSYCVVGPNGMGKTTLLKVCTQQVRQQSGKLNFAGHKLQKDFYQQMFVLPQNPAALFMKETVAEELVFQIKKSHSSKELTEILKELTEILKEFSLSGLEQKSPYDLSGGQQEFLALALGFIKQPQLLFLDEPTKGLDPNKRIALGKLLQAYQKAGGTIFINAHDLIFAAEYFDQVAMMFDGKLSDFATPQEFFQDKFFYTTEINKALREIYPQALIWKDIQYFES